MIDTNRDISPVVHTSSDSRTGHMYTVSVAVSSLYKTVNKLKASKTSDYPKDSTTMPKNQLSMEHSDIGLPPINIFFHTDNKIVRLKHFLKNIKINLKPNEIKLKIISVPYGVCH